MTLIFLDIDGVLNGHEKLASGYCGIRPDCAARLNRLLETVPDAMLVISSAWRYMILRGDMTLKGFEYLLLVHGVQAHGRVLGHTEADDELCNEPNHFDADAWKAIGLRMRAEQIRKYIAHAGATRFVVLDDLPLEVESLVQTDGAIGLTDEDVECAILVLTRPQEIAA